MENEAIKDPIRNEFSGPGSSEEPYKIIITEEYGPGMETNPTSGPGM